MTPYRRLFRNPKTAVAAGLTGSGLLMLLGAANVAAVPLSCPLGTAGKEVLGMLVAIGLAALSQYVEAGILDYPCWAQNFEHSLVSLWLLLCVIGGAVLWRAAFAGKVDG